MSTSAEINLSDLPPLDPSGPARCRSYDWLPILLSAGVFIALSLWAAVRSAGFLEADSCTHYQYARFALAEPHYLVNVWGRPFVTALYAIPATLTGRIGVRATSLFCALVIATIAYLIARDQKYRWPALAFVFTLAQPLLFLHSFSELTELPFTVLLTLGFWAYCRKQWLVMAIMIALTPTARPEGFGFLFLAAVALICHRRWWWLIVLPIPLLLWTYIGWRLYGRPEYFDPLTLKLPQSLRWLMWLRHEWPYQDKSAYASGYLLYFVAILPVIVSPLLFPFVVIGGAVSLFPLSVVWERVRVRVFERRSQEPSPRPSPGVPGEGEKGEGADHHRQWCQILILAIPLMILVGHSTLYWLGRMASNGEPRYMLIVAPFWALLAAAGWEWTFTRLNWRRPYLWACMAAVLPIFINLYYPVLPIGMTTVSYKAQAAARWYRDSRASINYPRLLSSNPEVTYFLGVSLTDGGWVREWRKENIKKAPPGTLLIWDPVYGLFNADANRIIPLEEIHAAGWVELPDVSAEFNNIGAGPEWRVFVSPTSIFGKSADEAWR